MKQYIIIAVVCAGLFACSKSGGFLDNRSTGISEEQVFTDSARTEAFLNRIYVDIGFSFNKGRWSGHGNSELATDDAEYSLSGATQAAVVLYNGTVSPTFQPNGIPEWFTTPYANIRRCNLLLQKLSATPLSAARQVRFRGEARFLRAWYYTQMLIVYGSVPNIRDSVFSSLENTIVIPRTPFAELVSYLTTELDAAGADLPNTNYDFPDQRDFGRATKGACMALKARLLLYAASPLFNGGAIAGTSADLLPLVGYPTTSLTRWQLAADAALAVINSGFYELWRPPTSTSPGANIPGYGFYQTFLNGRPGGTGTMNKELIYGLMRPAGKDFEGYYNPGGGSYGGAHYSVPTQQLAEAFPMKNGKAITDPTSGFNSANPYVNRDPRFNFSIIFNGSRYAQGTTQSIVYTNYVVPPATNNQGLFGGTATGYFSRKMLDSTFSSTASNNLDRPWPLIRYAEILLNYAEAINEAGQTNLAYARLQELRSRAGIDTGANGLYGMKAGMTQTEMRAFVQNERRIELMNEDHRFNDIRRWKIAEAVNNGYNRVMKITGAAPNWVYTISNTQEFQASRMHVFKPAQYLLPFPDDEVRKNPAMLQNPGW